MKRILVLFTTLLLAPLAGLPLIPKGSAVF